MWYEPNNEPPLMWELKISGSLYTERDELKRMANLHEAYSAIDEAKSEIRKRTKHGSNETEEQFLERLFLILCSPGVE